MSGGKGRSLLGWLLGAAEPPPPTRLTADQVVALAAASPGVRDLGRALPIATPYRNGDRTVWRVTSGGVGAQWWVEVEDTTGQVGEVRHAPGR
ncbi:hypothetical protein [Caulobacter sp. S45]|uniref:hypothetical protein n=1 Tax=Caulobacter sp. S45 TaxID=1641861 RepID=UPI001575BAEF|nr:hypothetical protein [Caulobacter sp. S45]